MIQRTIRRPQSRNLTAHGNLLLFCTRGIIVQTAKLNETRQAVAERRTSLVRFVTLRLAAGWVSNLALRGKNAPTKNRLWGS